MKLNIQLFLSDTGTFITTSVFFWSDLAKTHTGARGPKAQPHADHLRGSNFTTAMRLSLWTSYLPAMCSQFPHLKSALNTSWLLDELAFEGVIECKCLCSVMFDSAILRTVAQQAPLSIGFSQQEYWSGLSCPPPRDLPNLGSNPHLLHSWQILYL